MSGWTRAERTLQRWGGALLRPRTAVAAIPLGEGTRDGIWLGCLYVISSRLPGLVAATASAWTLFDGSSALLLAAAFGRALIGPIVVVAIGESLLGPRRAHLRGLALLPMLATTLVLEILPVAQGWRGDGTTVVSGVVALAWVVWVRPAVRMQEETS